MSLRFSGNSEAKASELLENLGRNVSSLLIIESGSWPKDRRIWHQNPPSLQEFDIPVLYSHLSRDTKFRYSSEAIASGTSCLQCINMSVYIPWGVYTRV